MCIRFTRMITWGHYFVFRIGQPLTEFGSSFIIMHVHTGTNLAVLLDTKGYNYMWIGQFLGGVFLASKSWAPSHPFSWWQQTASHYIRLVCASMGSCEKSPSFGIHSKRALTEWTGCMKMYWPESGNWEVGGRSFVWHTWGFYGWTVTGKDGEYHRCRVWGQVKINAHDACWHSCIISI